MATLVGTQSPAYRQMSEVRDLTGFNAVLPMCRRVIAAVASPHQAAEMGAGAVKRMGRRPRSDQGCPEPRTTSVFG